MGSGGTDGAVGRYSDTSCDRLCEIWSFRWSRGVAKAPIPLSWCKSVGSCHVRAHGLNVWLLVVSSRPPSRRGSVKGSDSKTNAIDAARISRQGSHGKIDITLMRDWKESWDEAPARWNCVTPPPLPQARIHQKYCTSGLPMEAALRYHIIRAAQAAPLPSSLRRSFSHPPPSRNAVRHAQELRP